MSRREHRPANPTARAERAEEHRAAAEGLADAAGYLDECRDHLRRALTCALGRGTPLWGAGRRERSNWRTGSPTRSRTASGSRSSSKATGGPSRRARDDAVHRPQGYRRSGAHWGRSARHRCRVDGWRVYLGRTVKVSDQSSSCRPSIVTRHS